MANSIEERLPDVRLVGVTKSFGRQIAVNDVSLDVMPGEFFTLLGPSGSGKSTVLRMLAGFETPTSGVIFIRGQDVSRVPPYRRPTSTVFQNYALFPHMTVAENVGFGLRVRNVAGPERIAAVNEALQVVQMMDKGPRRVHEISGGEQQRVALARSIITRPMVLLLDESLGALDEKLRKEMQGELKRLQRELAITFLYVTHVQEEALSMSDRIGILNHGQLEQVGTPQDIYNRPLSRFVADFIGGANILVGRGKPLGGGMAEIIIGQTAFTVWSHGGSVVSGQEAAFCIRQEKVRLGPPTPDMDNSVAGVIVAELFKGANYQYAVKLANGTSIRSQMSTRVETVEVLANWRSIDAILLR